MSFFQRTRPDCIIESFYTTSRQKKNDCFTSEGFVLIAILCLKQWVAFTTFVPAKKFNSLSLRGMFNVRVKKELENLRRSFIRGKGFTVLEKWECDWRRLYKASKKVKKRIRENFPCRHSLAAEQLLEEIKNNNQVHENLTANFANFHSIFKNNLVSKNDIGDLMKTYAEEEGIISDLRKKINSNFT